MDVRADAGERSPLTLLLGRLLDPSHLQSRSTYLGIVSQWTLITLAVGLLGGWILRLQTAPGPPENAAYASAVLAQLGHILAR